MSQTEQLLRRMTGSITAYMDEVGAAPPAHERLWTERCWRSGTGNLMLFCSALSQGARPGGRSADRGGGAPRKNAGGNIDPDASCRRWSGFLRRRTSPPASRAVRRGMATGGCGRWWIEAEEPPVGAHALPTPVRSSCYAYANDCQNIAKDLIDPMHTGADRRRAPEPAPPGRGAVWTSRPRWHLVDKGVQPGR